MQEPRGGVVGGGRALLQGVVQLGEVAPVQPVRGVREGEVPAGLQDRLHPPAQPVPGTERASVPPPLLAEPFLVAVHREQRAGGVAAQRVQAEPGVGHAGVEPDGGAELLLGPGVGPGRVGVHGTQPGAVGEPVRSRAARGVAVGTLH